MRKYLLGSILAVIGCSLYLPSYADNDCRDVDFDEGKVCMSIEKENDGEFKLVTDKKSGDGTLSCRIMLEEKNKTETIDNCNDTFYVNKEKEQRVKIYIRYNGQYPTDRDGKKNSSQVFPQRTYDFNNEEWADSISSSSSSSNNGDIDKFIITLADSTPSINNEVKLTLKAVDSDGDTLSDYDGSNAKVTVAYRTSSSSSWSTTTSSTYFSIDDNTPNFSNGSASTYITFKKDYQYRITVTDNDSDVDTQKTISAGSADSSSSSDGDLDKFSISLADSTPSINSEVKLTLKARDSNEDTLSDYDGSNAKVTVAYRTSSSSSWNTTTSSTYFSIDDTTPDFSNGSASTYITFKKNYQYRITVTDNDSDISTQKTFSAGSASSSSSNNDLDDFSIVLDDSSPDTNDSTKLTIEATDNNDETISDYNGSNAKVTVAYRTSSSSSWSTTTSSTYFSIDDATPDFNDGVADTNITFKKDYQYKITVTDNDSDIFAEKTFYIGSASSSSSSEIKDFSITLADSTPSIGNEVKLTLKALNGNGNTMSDYDGSNAKVTVAYRTSSSASWNTTTSSTYFSINDNTPDFSNGSASTYITFKKNYQYRITVTDNDSNISTKKTFSAGSASSSSSDNSDLDEFSISLNDSSPDKDTTYILTVKAYDSSNSIIEDYDGSAKITVQYRNSSSSYWSNASTSYAYLQDSTPDFNDGIAKVNIKFKKEYEYKIIVEDTDENISTTKQYDIGNSSSSSEDLYKYTVSMNDSTPSQNQQILFTIKGQDKNGTTISDYEGSAKITASYRRNSSYSRSSLSTSSSTYIDIDDSTPNFDNGIAETYITFKYNYEYQLKFTDSEDDTVYKTLTIGVGSSNGSTVDGFTSSQITELQKIYDNRDKTISTYKDNYPNLKNNSTWLKISDTIRDEIENILENRSYKKYTTYADFNTAYKLRVQYTNVNK